MTNAAATNLVNFEQPHGGADRPHDKVTLKLDLPVGALAVQAAPPTHVSQKTVETAIGVPRRHFLESLPAFQVDGGTVLRLGRLRIVERSSYIAWLAGRVDNEAEPTAGVDALAESMGLQLLGP